MKDIIATTKKKIQTELGLDGDFYWCECSGSVEEEFKKHDVM